MRTLLDQIKCHAFECPEAPALKDEQIQLDYCTLQAELERLSGKLEGNKVGLLMDNGVHWACLDLALMNTHKVCVPMPGFFSNFQLEHLVKDACLDWILTDNPVRVAELPGIRFVDKFEVAGRIVWSFKLDSGDSSSNARTLPAGTIKITYTSGTTGQPKGVCLSAPTLMNVILSLCKAVDANAGDRSLSLLPLSTLLENISGLYAPLWVGALAQIPGLASCGFSGSTGLQPAQIFKALDKYAPTTTVLVPQLLKVMVDCIVAGIPAPSSLRFIALGGAPSPVNLINRAKALGLPVYQGYGLSEAVSVVSLNTSSHERPGSVGSPLPHVHVSIADDGEVVVSGSVFLGYLGNELRASDDEWHTGDLGYLDEEGFLYLTGRKKTAYATAYGRNVSPEWVESELTSHPFISQAVVFGEGQAINVAVLVPSPNAALNDLHGAMDVNNSRLPDYARVSRWIVADQPFSHRNGLANSAGCVQREAVRHQYKTRIEKLFATEAHHVVL